METTMAGLEGTGDDLFAELGDSFQFDSEGNIDLLDLGDDGALDFSGVFGDEGDPTTPTTPGEDAAFAQEILSLSGNDSASSLPVPMNAVESGSAASMQQQSSSLTSRLHNAASPAMQNLSQANAVSQMSFGQQQHQQLKPQESSRNAQSIMMNQQHQHQQNAQSMAMQQQNMSMNQQQNAMNPPSSSSYSQFQFQQPTPNPSSNNFSNMNTNNSNHQMNVNMPPPMAPFGSNSVMSSNPSAANNNRFGNAAFSSGGPQSMNLAANPFLASLNQPSKPQQQQQPRTTSSLPQWNRNVDLEKPKRPLSAYDFFLQERKHMSKMNEDQLESVWKEQLDGHQKEIYLQQARVDRQRYISELKLWKSRTERSQPAGAIGNFFKSRLQNKGSDTNLVEANRRGRLQPAIVSCPNLNASPSVRLRAQQMQMSGGGGGNQNATFGNFGQHQQGSQPRSRFVADQMSRLQRGQGLTDLASELGDDATRSFVTAMIPRSQSTDVVPSATRRLLYKQQSSPNMNYNPMMDSLQEYPGY
jgi:hypothetical protein